MQRTNTIYLRTERMRSASHDHDSGNQCAGIVVFLVLGTLCNVLAYLASVWSAQLNADVVKSAVENEHTLRFKLKKSGSLE